MTVPGPAARVTRLVSLPSDGFVPPADVAPWSLATQVSEFRAAVEAFAAAYWSLAPAERRERYNRLWESRSGAAAARLGLLAGGLDFEADDAGGGNTPADVVRTVLRRLPPPSPMPRPGLLAWQVDGDEAPFYDDTPVAPDEFEAAAVDKYASREARLLMWLARATVFALVILLLLCMLSNLVT